MYTQLSEAASGKGTAQGLRESDLLGEKDVQRANEIIAPDARKAVRQGLDFRRSGNTVADIPAGCHDDVMRGKWESGEVMNDAQFDELFALWDKAQLARGAFLSNEEYGKLQYGRGNEHFDKKRADDEETAREKEKRDNLVAGLRYMIDQQAEYREYFVNHPYQTDAERAERVRKFNERQAWEKMKRDILNEPDEARRNRLIQENADLF